MKQTILFEIYEGEGRNGKPKKYVVCDYRTKSSEVFAHCKRLFHCAIGNIVICNGYIWKDELYLTNPAIPGAKLVTVAYYHK